MNKHIIFGIVALILMVATTYIPNTVSKKSDMKSVAFGWPFAFVSQDYSDRQTTFPVTIWFSTSHLESKDIDTTLIQFPFFFDLALYFGLVEIVGMGFEKVYEKKS